MKRKPDSSNSDISVVTPLSGSTLPPGVKWMPVLGEETSGVLSRNPKLDEGSRKRLIESSAVILGSGVDPRSLRGSATGLVVGLVQSGKTMSFTTVMALARDNGFPLIILIAGNKDNLLTQSHDRLSADLDTERDSWSPAWKIRKNIRGSDPQEEQFVRQTLAGWTGKANADDERATLILTVLKQNQRLAALTELIRKFDLKKTPVLLIDDEADQASLNTRVRQGQESTTYMRLRELRDAIPCHTYLQYTATPQAPLLINIADTLSPDFVHVLEPGSDYVGGAEFFAQGSPYVVDIPPTDSLAQGMPTDPPESMLEAMRIFFVGLAAGRTRRSMLIHPSRMRDDHRDFAQWALAAKNQWEKILSEPARDPDRKELVKDFRRAYDEISSTTPDIPSFDDVMKSIPGALRYTTPIEFNTNGRPKTPEIRWKEARGWILVGGQAVDRGFTVNALTVTYMPRGVGLGNADTLQQRARFFGYKRPFLGLCRIYLDQPARTAFEDYVEHENLMRVELSRLADQGISLKSWRRRFVLEPSMQPCRKSIMSDSIARARGGNAWLQQRGAVITRQARTANAKLIDAMAKKLSFGPDTSYISTEPAQQHLVASAPLKAVLDMLVEYQLEDPRDTASFTGVMIVMAEALQRDRRARASVYRMRPRAVGGYRTVDEEGNLDDGFIQGRTRRKDGTVTYPGDESFAAPDCVSIQLHSYDLRDEDGVTMVQAAPLLAINVPPNLAAAWLVQVQRGQDPTA